MSGLDSRALTWAGLLSKWIEFAQGAVALPDDAAGRAWKASTVSIIELQAVTFALAEIDELDAGERAVARDKAAVLIDRAVGALERVWGEAGLPDGVQEIISDARAAVEVVATLETFGSNARLE